MIDMIPDAFVAASVVLILALLIFSGLKHPGIPVGARVLVLVGFVFLLVGSVLRTVAHLLPVTGNDFINIRVWMPQLSTGLGYVMLAVGVFRLLDTFVANFKGQRLDAQLARASAELQSTQGILNSLMSSSLSGMMVFRAVRDASKEIIDFECRIMNGAAQQLLGIPREQLMNSSLLKQLPCLKENDLFNNAVGVVDTGLPFTDERGFRQHQDGCWYQIVAVKHGDGFAVTVTDVSDRKRFEQGLQRAARHDMLTDLPNRGMLMERVQQAIIRSRRDPKYHFAVMFLDFDRFKTVNDTLGHEVGDQLLISIAERLRASMRAIDSSGRSDDQGHMPARLGGDEFVVFLDGIREPQNAVIVADRLQRELAAPHRIAGHEIVSTASIGIAHSNPEYEFADQVIKDADTAMYQAKTTGKARHVVYDQNMVQTVSAPLHLERQLREAVERKAFRLVYQPIIALSTGRITAFEALIRWPHPERGVVEPHEFIGLAEEFGLIVSIGEWVLAEATRTLKSLQTQCDEYADLIMNVNMSKHELTSPKLFETLERVTREAGIDPATLRLEVTESMCMNDLELLEPVLHEVKRIGVSLAMDDFGAGASSLQCLDTLPFDVLKIDQSFVRTKRRTRDLAAFINAMVDLAHNLSLPVVVEGVETEEQLGMLQTLGCDFGQGWLFSEAVSAVDAAQLLDSNRQMSRAA